jgi:integrase
MYAKTPTGRASKGSVSIVSSNGRLQLVFRYGGQRRFLSMGLADTPQNRQFAESKAGELESDILAQNVDESWAKYKLQSRLSLVVNQEEITTKPQPKLSELWEKYTEFQSTQLEASTIQVDYRKVARRIEKLPHQDVTQAIAVREYLLKTYSTEVSRRTLKELERCCGWAKQSGLIETNPFRDLASDLKLTKSGKKTLKAYTAEEREAIIEAFRGDTYCHKCSPTPHSHYANFVAFLFLTGCRPQDATALKWKHIKPNHVVFSEAYSCEARLTKTGKTKTIRPFPVNAQLRAVIEALSKATTDRSPEVLIFPSPKGKPIDRHNFLNRVWKPVVEALVQDGKVAEYLPTNNTRHTFISMCVEKGMDAKDIAPMVGNSAKVIYENYASKKREITIPEL